MILTRMMQKDLKTQKGAGRCSQGADLLTSSTGGSERKRLIAHSLMSLRRMQRAESKFAHAMDNLAAAAFK